MPRQLAFDWPLTEAMGAEAFFVTEANRAAHALVMAPDRWPEGKLVLTGPEGSGKTHLARLFADRSGAAILPARALSGPLPDGATVIEGADTIPPASEEWLFHAHNRLRALGRPLLMTARSGPARWPLTLPDLASRMGAATLAVIDPPDDALLAAVLMKQFQDRQLAPAPEALSYLLRHMPRRFDTARRLVAALDATALAEGRGISRMLARQVLDTLPDQAD
ncbi:MAG: hypothetical protein HLUCCA08_11560 [Rhodobacteraceae bacterium HLUCCA08]|nr:MAG: hypothetical protein HLUCCA08_11560 [Rhodobacteraceae bacterium HLUCCA08]